MQQINIGVLAIIGSFNEHINSTKLAFEEGQRLGKWKGLSLNVVNVNKKEQLTDNLHGLIIPGGESTVMSTFLKKDGFLEVTKEWINIDTKFTWGTCAGMILLCNEVKGSGRNAVSLGGIDVICQRNAFGRQYGSSEREFEIVEKKIVSSLSSDNRSKKFTSITIRGPAIDRINNEGVSVLCRDEDECNLAYDPANAVQQGNKMASSFHPELTDELRWHSYFIDQVLKRSSDNLLNKTNRKQ